ncbi:hypothetical protein HYP06_gp071 [Vibrio phage vB_VspP_pVa5]|uniref:Uncharacterized protein n=1 Tax=Vibrio phage vB_VspP_pVa5 TaxID=1913109 RepID=A0A1J0GVB7_9CAUD|nr:hypothetical protein HYP06_gp071 [Vibrio phage vB_VspP_pVa5]APC46120.1 hypothetical protein vBVspPpVa5_0102 [Vibrio phage vB_VspP_pVa5]
MLMNIWLLIKLPYNLFRIMCHIIFDGATYFKHVNDQACQQMEERALRAKEEQSNQPKGK